MTCPLLVTVLLVLCCVTAALAAPATLYVAPNGNDSWSGRLPRPNTARSDGPLATIARARDEVRSLKAASPGGICVEIAAGTYEFPATLELAAADSGSPTCPIEYRGKGEVRIVGGRTLGGWSVVRDPAVLKRLPACAHGKVYQTDLKAAGITDLQGINNAGVYRSDPGLELFFRDQAMTLARYPNSGYMRLAEVLDNEGNPGKSGMAETAAGRFVCDDPRPAAWQGEKDIWLHGFWVYDWSDERLQLGTIEADKNTISLQPKPGRTYRLRKNQWFYAQNVLTELDTPGEWYLDRDTSLLYFWPPSPLSKGKAVVSTVRDLVRLKDVSNVTFRGLTLETGRGTAVLVNGGSNIRVVGCTIRNMGNWAVRVSGGTSHGVVGCDIYQTGQGGISLDGGNRKTLTPAGHYADNNHIHHTSRWDPVYQQAIALRGVGNSATHNLIDNVPHIAIGFADNDMTVEYNEIHSSVYQSNDAGAIYTSPPDETWSMRGHKIRYNYLHNIHGFESRGCMGVYLDDCFSSADISHNIFYDVANAILIGGGRDNSISNNMFINCRVAFTLDARGLGWAKGVGNSATKELLDLNYKQPPWSLKYPELLGILEDEPLAPKGNSITSNICWGGPWGRIEPRVAELVKVQDNLIDVDPKFVGKPPSSFRLAADSPARKLGFSPIPFRRIGLYESPDRASWPVTSVLRKDPPPPAAKPKPVTARKATAAPVFDVPRRQAAVTIDGMVAPEEWMGLDPAKGLVLQEGVDGEKCQFKTQAWMMWDDEALYVAFDNTVDRRQQMNLDSAWGGSDAVEVSISNAASGPKAPILILRGFACGAFNSSDEAGAPANQVRKAGENVQYKAKVISASRWVAEMRIPFASLGLNPRADLRHPFNLAVRKQGDEPWVMWRGTGGCTWLVPEAGRIRFAQ